MLCAIEHSIRPLLSSLRIFILFPPDSSSSAKQRLVLPSGGLYIALCVDIPDSAAAVASTSPTSAAAAAAGEEACADNTIGQERPRGSIAWSPVKGGGGGGKDGTEEEGAETVPHW